MDGIDAVIDQPTAELDLVDQPIDETPEEAPEAEPEAAPQEKIDGRKFNPEWSKKLKELNELYPDNKDMLTKLRDNYARYQALQEVAPKGLEDVRAWKTTIDAIGGPEAAAELMQRAASYEQIDSKIETGDFSVIDDLPENLQGGFYKMLPDAINAWQEKDPDGFGKAIAPHFSAALAGTGMGDHLKTLYGLLGENEQAKASVKQMYEWYQQQTSGQGKMPNGAKSVDPQVQRLQEQLNTREQADKEAFIQGTVQTTQKYMGDTFKSLAESYVKQFNLTQAQQDDLLDSAGAKLSVKLDGDPAFKKQLGAYMALKNRSKEQVDTYIRSKVDENAKNIIDGLVTARYGGMRKKAAVADAKATTTTNGAVRVAQAPDPSQWDRDKMEANGYENTVKKGIFYLQGGRTVQLSR